MPFIAALRLWPRARARRMRTSRTIAALLAALSVPALAQPSFHRIDGLGGTPFTAVNGLSPDGSTAVGHSIDVSGDVGSYRWTLNAGTVGMGIPSGVGFSSAQGVSFGGAYIVGYNQRSSGGRYTAYRWSEAGGYLDLGDLAGGSRSSLAMDVSDDGRTVVGFGNYEFLAGEGFIWREGEGMKGIGDLPGGAVFSQAVGVSRNGRYVVGGSQTDDGFVAFRWSEESGMESLGDLPGGEVGSGARDITDDGRVIVGSANSGRGTEAFRWVEGEGMTGLGDLPGGQAIAFATAVTADGDTVIGYSDTGVGTIGTEAFIWDEARGMRRLQAVLEDYGLDLEGWILERATGISADGRVIAGYGTDPAGATVGWVAEIPAPASAWIIAIPGLAAARRR